MTDPPKAILELASNSILDASYHFYTGFARVSVRFFL